MNTNKVRVTADADGNVVNVSKNPEVGYIRLEQKVPFITADGWLRVTKRTTLMHGSLQDLVESGFYKNQELPGKILVIESFEPFNTEDPDRDIKRAGRDGVICRVDDQPIYRKTIYTTDLEAQDQIIMHNNVDEIRDSIQAKIEMERLSRQKADKVNL